MIQRYRNGVMMNDDLSNDPRDSFHVILVEPAKSLNIGAVARAMMNLGFRNLHLVAPPQYDRERANVTACWAEPLLDTMQFHETFEDAISDMEEVVGLSGRSNKNQPHFVTLLDWTENLPSRPLRKTALVFGPEDNGLRQEHLNQCRWIIRIPSSEENPSFNLAQSVLLVLYEITQALPDAALMPSVPAREAPTTWNDLYQLDHLLDSVMREGEFIRSGSPGSTPDIVKNFFRRMEITPQERAVLMGLFGRINSTLRRRRSKEEASHD